MSKKEEGALRLYEHINNDDEVENHYEKTVPNSRLVIDANDEELYVFEECRTVDDHDAICLFSDCDERGNNTYPTGRRLVFANRMVECFNEFQGVSQPHFFMKDIKELAEGALTYVTRSQAKDIINEVSEVRGEIYNRLVAILDRFPEPEEPKALDDEAFFEWCQENGYTTNLLSQDEVDSMKSVWMKMKEKS